MSSPRRSRKSFDVSMLRPPAITPVALAISAGSLMPGGTSVRTKWTVVPGW
jgi:hypothetical protein